MCPTDAGSGSLAAVPVGSTDACLQLGDLYRLGPQNEVQLDEAAFARRFEARTARLPGMHLHYLIGGEGPPVVLLHGNLRTSRVWRRVMAVLSSRFTVVAPDLRGLGRSSRPDAGYDKRTVAADVHALVGQLGYADVALVGHDLGGWVAYAFAANHRASASHLVIVDVFLPGFGLEPAMDPARGGSFHYGFNMTPDLPEVLVAGKEREFIAWFGRRNTVVPGAISPEDAEEYARQYSEPGAMRAAFAYYRTALPIDSVENRETAKLKLRIPTLAIGAEFGGGDITAQDLRQVAEGVSFALIEQCGHNVPEDRPWELAQTIAAFLESGDPPRID